MGVQPLTPIYTRAGQIIFDTENCTMRLTSLANAVDLIASSMDLDMKPIPGTLMTLCDYLRTEIGALDSRLTDAHNLITGRDPANVA